MIRVLIIDDLPDVRAVISMVLRFNHFTTVEAISGTAGLKHFSESRFDLAIVDIYLQDTNGIDVINELRAHAPKIPIVAISGMTTLGLFAEEPNFADIVFLQKPFRPNELLRAIAMTGIPIPKAPYGPIL